MSTEPRHTPQKKLGLGDGRGGHYDLPLEHDSSTRFLILLTGLMTFLALLALAGAFMTGAITHHWSAGLAGKATVEIPAEQQDGSLRTTADIKELTQIVHNALSAQDHISSADILDTADIQTLIEPWLGSNNMIASLPLPGLVAVTFKNTKEETIDDTRKILSEIAPNIYLDTHEAWLSSLLRIMRSLQLVTICVVLIVLLVTLITVTGAMHARMQIHKDYVELLHLMGAGHEYIARQFQRHARIIAFKGSALGMLAGLLTLFLLGIFIGQNNILPSGTGIGIMPFIIMILTPLPVCFMASLSVRYTVLHSLNRMP